MGCLMTAGQRGRGALSCGVGTLIITGGPCKFQLSSLLGHHPAGGGVDASL